MVNIVKEFLISLSNLLQMNLQLPRKGQFQKTAEAIGDLIGSKIADRITKISKRSQQSNSETITNEHKKEIPKKYLQKKNRKLLVI